MAKIPTLTEVNLAQCSAITDEGLAALGKLPLTRLDVSSCAKIDGSAFEAFEAAVLQELNLHGCSIDDQGLLNLAKFKQLVKLRLDENDSIKGEGLDVLKNFKSLQELTLSGLPVSNENLNLMAGITSLKELRLDGCSMVSGLGLASLTGSALERLDLKDCRRFDAEEDFREIGRLKSLKYLNVAGTRMRPECVPLLTQLSSLGELDVSGCNWVDDSSIGELAKIKTLRTLKLDDLARLTDAALVHLAQLPNLERLELGKNRMISGEGFDSFPSTTGLRFLELRELDKLTPDGLKNLPRFSKLEKLTIDSVKLSNEHLIAMKGMPNLKDLELDDTSQVDENVYRILRASLPNLKD